MKFYLTVLDGMAPMRTGSTLHEYVLSKVTGLWVPEGAWVQLPVGSEDDSVNGYVRRTYFDLRTAEVHVELMSFRLDPPPDQPPNQYEAPWRTEQDGDLRAMLTAGGWRKL